MKIKKKKSIDTREMIRYKEEKLSIKIDFVKIIHIRYVTTDIIAELCMIEINSSFLYSELINFLIFESYILLLVTIDIFFPATIVKLENKTNMISGIEILMFVAIPPINKRIRNKEAIVIKSKYLVNFNFNEYENVMIL